MNEIGSWIEPSTRPDVVAEIKELNSNWPVLLQVPNLFYVNIYAAGLLDFHCIWIQVTQGISLV
jgi:hypothetical protein